MWRIHRAADPVDTVRIWSVLEAVMQSAMKTTDAACSFYSLYQNQFSEALFPPLSVCRYKATGRGFNLQRMTFVKVYSSYARTHLYFGMEILLWCVVLAISLDCHGTCNYAGRSFCKGRSGHRHIQAW